MFLRHTYTTVSSGQLDAQLPLTAIVAPGTSVTLQDGSEERLELVVEQRVDPLALELVTETRRYEMRNGQQVELPALRVRGGDSSNVLAWDFLGALSFLTDVSFKLAASLVPAQYVPENEEDEAALQAFGTCDAYARIIGSPSIRTITPLVSGETIQALLPKREGLRLYADALSLGYPVAQFRELWRVLESAFGAQDDKLIDLLASYTPALEIDFDREEFKALGVLRGRASHARSRSGLDELLAVGRECGERVNRLKSLVERVIVTKATWGAPTAAVEELMPAAAWVGRGNVITIMMQGPDRGSSPPL